MVWRDPEPDCPGPECVRCSGEYCDIHILDPCDCDVTARHRDDIRRRESQEAPHTPQEAE